MRIMPNYRTASCLAGLLGLLLLPSALWGQQAPQNYDDVYANGNAPYSMASPTETRGLTPFGPVGFKPNWKLFAPVDISNYGNGIKPRKGFFFSYERMLMSTSRASTSGIGANNATEGDSLQFLNVISSPVTAPITANAQAQAGFTAFNALEPYVNGKQGVGLIPGTNTPAYFPTATGPTFVGGIETNPGNPIFPTAAPNNPVFYLAGAATQINVPFADLNYQNIVGGNYNSDTTGVLSSRFGTGNRWEFGYMDTDDTGWLVSILDHISSGQNVSLPGGTVLFNDPTGFLQGYQTSISGDFDADLNGNHIYGRNGYALPQITNTAGTTVASGSATVAVTASVSNIVYPVGPTSPAPIDSGLFFPQVTLNNTTHQVVALGSPNSTTYNQVGGDEVVFTPTFTALQISDKVTTTGTELMRMYRTPQLHGGGTIDLLIGARYLQLNDVFQVYGTGGPFDAMTITQKVLNNVVGPQIGARYAHQRGRWSVWSEGRFFPSANFAVERNYSVLASNSQPSTTANSNGLNTSNGTSGISNTSTTSSTSSSSSSSGGASVNAQGPAIEKRDAPAALLYGALTSSSGLNNMQFSPACEFRFGTDCWLTQGVAFKCSYTGIFLPNMTRASNSIDYTLPNIGIINGGHHQAVILNGLTIGIEINR
ncbi:MAG TPA: hypothetical protein VHY91_11590 [Pirellulales bacterium]|jgi:hypothetical protein|nr:hypothetical protein [Pirellulales bacterium]